MPIVIEALRKDHDRTQFASGQEQVDAWFRLRAGQDDRRDVARVFVAVDDSLGIVGFYSLSSFALAAGELPESIARKLPRYDLVPAVLIGRLARDQRLRGTGVGDILLSDALRRALTANLSVAIFAIVVDAKDDRGVSFYKTFGFAPFPTRPRRLFLPSVAAAEALARSKR